MCDLTRPSATLPVLENYNSNRYSQLSLKCALLTNASQSYISSIQLRLVSQGLLPAPSISLIRPYTARRFLGFAILVPVKSTLQPESDLSGCNSLDTCRYYRPLTTRVTPKFPTNQHNL